MRSADYLEVISRYGVGVDNGDLKTCRNRNTIVTNTPGANASSVAELAIGLLLCQLRKIPQAVSSTWAGASSRTSGFSLDGKTVEIVEFFAIGKALPCCHFRPQSHPPGSLTIFGGDHEER